MTETLRNDPRTPATGDLKRPSSLAMGEIACVRHVGVLSTLLGSCLGLALYDRRLKLGALAHVVLPQSLGRTERPGKFMDSAVPAMIRQLQELAVHERLGLQARIAGGANMFGSVDAIGSIGIQNIQAAEETLRGLRITIVARHCGGTQGRRMSLDVATGIVTIQVVGEEPSTI